MELRRAGLPHWSRDKYLGYHYRYVEEADGSPDWTKWFDHMLKIRPHMGIEKANRIKAKKRVQ